MNGRRPVRRLARALSAWLLPLWLLLAQAGALHHELGHLERAARTGAAPASAPLPADGDADRCPMCLAFAPLGSAAAGGIAVPALRDGLSFARVDTPSPADASLRPPVPRSRAPPLRG